MADETPQRRVLPARDRRESAAKRRATSPEPAPTPAKKNVAPTVEPRPKRKYTKRASTVRSATPSGPSTPSVIEDVIPTKLTSSKPLPSTRQKQATSLSRKEYQSIADSAILAASLHRSRAQWLVEGVFKKYWTKPVKKKGVVDVPPNNPEQKSMQKLGNGTITIEPHKFDVSFYAVREPQAPTPYYRPPTQPPPQPASVPVVPHPAPFTPPVGTASAKQEIPNTPSVSTPAPQASAPAPFRPASATPSSQPAPPTRPTSDPVIQMLAARASTNLRLKELMKVVATSQASQEQLKEFQGHIDEFNAVVRKQEAEKAEKEKQQQKGISNTAEVRPAQKVTATTPMPTPSLATPYSATPSRPPVAGPPPPLYASYPAPPRPEPIIKHIVMEFHGEGTNQDRWLFPEFAVLDIKYGDVEMICSFLVERKGSEVISSLGGAGGSGEETTVMQAKWKPVQEYYQPVTMLVRANQHRTIETIARAAKVLPDVQEHMRSVMKSKTLSAQEYLVHQLPREKGLVMGEIASVDFVDSAVEMLSDEEDDELQDFYGNV